MSHSDQFIYDNIDKMIKNQIKLDKKIKSYERKIEMLEKLVSQTHIEKINYLIQQEDELNKLRAIIHEEETNLLERKDKLEEREINFEKRLVNN